MPRMIDLIRASAVPHNIVHSAAKGALSIPGPEMMEILVYLATHDQAFGEQASLTLAGWDEKASLAMAGDPAAPQEVLDYLASPKNLRPALLPALLTNPAVSDTTLAEIAIAAPREAVDSILSSARAEHSSFILEALHSNPHLSGIQAEQIRNRLSPAEPPVPPHDPPPAQSGTASSPSAAEVAEEGDVLSPEMTAYLAENAAEIEASEKPFHPIGGIQEIRENVLESQEPEARAAAAAANGGSRSAASGAKAQIQRGSALQKISQLDVKGRIQLAMKGNKEERSILVRDGTKVVALGVLESPKITDAEVEAFANQKNVLESLLRGISMKRRFMKNYNVVRNLVANPRTPLDVSLGLMKNLQIQDLKNISGNKDVPDTIRKLALKTYKQKRDSNKG